MSPYCDTFGGSVLNATIDRYVYAVVEDLRSTATEFEIVERDFRLECETAAFHPIDGTLDLHKGVYNRIVRDFLGGVPRSIKLSSMSESPPGSGLGSSSALVVAMVQAMAEFFQLPLSEYDVAHLAYEIERIDLKLAGGKQDQYAAAFGGFNFMEFQKDGLTLVNPLKIKPSVVSELEASLVLYFTGISRESANIVEEQVRNVLRSDARSINAMHQLKEESVAMKRHVLRGELAEFAKTLDASWQAKKRMAHHISNPLIDRVEAAARGAGAIACKVSGAGGGGFMMFFVDPQDRIRLVTALAGLGGQVSGCHFTGEGASAWKVA